MSPLLLIVECKGCGLWANTEDGAHPNTDQVLHCSCCPLAHDHDAYGALMGIPCRPVNITLINPIELQPGIGQPRSSVFADGMTAPEQLPPFPQQN